MSDPLKASAAAVADTIRVRALEILKYCDQIDPDGAVKRDKVFAKSFGPNETAGLIPLNPLRKLGKAKPRHDPRTLQMSDYTELAVEPPKACNWADRVDSWLMFKNDTIGDCTCASAAHLIMSWTSEATVEIVPTDDDVLNAYANVSGYDPANGLDDNGAVELDVLNYWRTKGIAGHKILAFTKVAEKNLRQVRQGVWIFGGLYAGFDLPLSAQGCDAWNVADRATADAAGTFTGNAAPGSWGGHAVPIVAYDSEGLTCITWGKALKMSWAFFAAYCDEAYACLSIDWLMAGGLSKSGFDLATLSQDLKAIQNA